MDLNAKSLYLLNKYFIRPVLSLNTSVTNLDSTVTTFTNLSSVIANTSSITRLNASTLANTSSILALNTSVIANTSAITRLNASVLANTSSIVDLNTSGLSLRNVNTNDFCDLGKTQLFIQNPTTNKSIKINIYDTTVASPYIRVTDVQEGITATSILQSDGIYFQYESPFFTPTISRPGISLAPNPGGTKFGLNLKTNGILKFTDLVGSTDQYLKLGSSGTAVWDTITTIGSSGTGTVTIGNSTNTTTINSGTINILNTNGATTAGSVNIANGTLQTTTVNIASGTGTGAVTIGNSANTVNINGTLAMGPGKNITLCDGTVAPTSGQLGYIIPNIYPTTTTLVNNVDTNILTQSLSAGTWLVTFQFRLYTTTAGTTNIFSIKIVNGPKIVGGTITYITESCPIYSIPSRTGSYVFTFTTATSISLQYYISSSAVFSILGANTSPNDNTYLQCVRIA